MACPRDYLEAYTVAVNRASARAYRTNANQMLHVAIGNVNVLAKGLDLVYRAMLRMTFIVGWGFDLMLRGFVAFQNR